MARKDVQLIQLANQAADFFAFSASFLLGGATLFYLHGCCLAHTPNFQVKDLQFLSVLYVAVNIVFLSMGPMSPAKRLRSYSEVARIYFKSVGTALLALMSVAYLIAGIQMCPTLLLSASCYAFLLLLGKEACMRQILFYFRRKDKNLRKVFLVGEDEDAVQKIRGEIENNLVLGLRVKGLITLKKDDRAVIADLPNKGSVEEFSAALDREVVDCVVFLEGYEKSGAVKDAIIKCDQRGLEIWVQFDFFKKTISQVDIESLGRIPFLNFHSGPQNAPALALKYAADRVLSLVLLVLFAPLFALVALGIKVASPGPVFFKQHRIGMNGRRFVFFKFRSMVNNAEQLKESLRAKNEMKGPVFKMKQDPRITPLGRFLRKTSLDELPQLWNVLRGDMSLVGPRPPIPAEVAQYTGWQRRRLSMNPGITCLWQVRGRNKIVDFDEWVHLDLEYIDQWSLFLDLKILLKTIPVVLKCTGV